MANNFSKEFEEEKKSIDEEANMSVAEIIAKRFKSKIKINQLSTEKDIQDFIIKQPEMNRF